MKGMCVGIKYKEMFETMREREKRFSQMPVYIN